MAWAHNPGAWWVQAVTDGLASRHGRVLHAACGDGWLVTTLVAAGVDAYGVDPHERVPGPGARRPGRTRRGRHRASRRRGLGRPGRIGAVGSGRGLGIRRATTAPARDGPRPRPRRCPVRPLPVPGGLGRRPTRRWKPTWRRPVPIAPPRGPASSPTSASTPPSSRPATVGTTSCRATPRRGETSARDPGPPRMNVAFVTPRYGAEVMGGAESAAPPAGRAPGGDRLARRGLHHRRSRPHHLGRRAPARRQRPQRRRRAPLRVGVGPGPRVLRTRRAAPAGAGRGHPGRGPPVARAQRARHARPRRRAAVERRRGRGLLPLSLLSDRGGDGGDHRTDGAASRRPRRAGVVPQGVRRHIRRRRCHLLPHRRRTPPGAASPPRGPDPPDRAGPRRGPCRRRRARRRRGPRHRRSSLCRERGARGRPQGLVDVGGVLPDLQAAPPRPPGPRLRGPGGRRHPRVRRHHHHGGGERGRQVRHRGRRHHLDLSLGPGVVLAGGARSVGAVGPGDRQRHVRPHPRALRTIGRRSVVRLLPGVRGRARAPERRCRAAPDPRGPGSRLRRSLLPVARADRSLRRAFSAPCVDATTTNAPDRQKPATPTTGWARRMFPVEP